MRLANIYSTIRINVVNWIDTSEFRPAGIMDQRLSANWMQKVEVDGGTSEECSKNMNNEDATPL